MGDEESGEDTAGRWDGRRRASLLLLPPPNEKMGACIMTDMAGCEMEAQGVVP